jgi:mRNA interferase RelE/StbE
MAYLLEFHPKAKKELDKLSRELQQQLLEKLAARLEHPRVPGDALRNLPDCYKIKLRSSGYRLVYQVQNRTITVLVLAIGKRDKLAAYESAAKRLK